MSTTSVDSALRVPMATSTAPRAFPTATPPTLSATPHAKGTATLGMYQVRSLSMAVALASVRRGRSRCASRHARPKSVPARRLQHRHRHQPLGAVSEPRVQQSVTSAQRLHMGQRSNSRSGGVEVTAVALCSLLCRGVLSGAGAGSNFEVSLPTV